MELPQKIKTNGKELDVASLSDKSKRLLADIIFAEQKISEHETSLRVLRLALSTLKPMLDKELETE